MWFEKKEDLEQGNGVYAIYDSAARAYGTPLVFLTHELAIRAFRNACLGGDSQIAQNKTEYFMFYLGRYVPTTGELIPLKVPEKIIAAVQIYDAAAASIPSMPASMVTHIDGQPISKG